MKNIRVILIGNYIPDKQESMQRFADMLKDGIRAKGVNCELWTPSIFFGKLVKSTNQGFKKWIGYLDKYLIFPIVLVLRLQKKEYKEDNVYFHICDHSNSPYLKYFPKGNTSITCHDVLAIRGALGFKDAYAEASKFGKILQNWILRNLKKAKTIASVSHFTLNQLKDLSKNDNLKEKEWIVIHNAFNAPFSPMDEAKYMPLLESMNMSPGEPFILHVGTPHPRKNRIFLVHMLNEMRDKWGGKLCLASKPLDNELIALAKQLGLIDRIVSVVRPEHENLVALYSACEAFVFPSLSEGFGWPVIEAQACGTPVIASDLEPMPEVSGMAAIHKDPKDAKAFANAFLKLKDKGTRSKLIEGGFENIKRFEVGLMIDSYLNLFSK